MKSFLIQILILCAGVSHCRSRQSENNISEISTGETNFKLRSLGVNYIDGDKSTAKILCKGDQRICWEWREVKREMVASLQSKIDGFKNNKLIVDTQLNEIDQSDESLRQDLDDVTRARKTESSEFAEKITLHEQARDSIVNFEVTLELRPPTVDVKLLKPHTKLNLETMTDVLQNPSLSKSSSSFMKLGIEPNQVSIYPITYLVSLPSLGSAGLLVGDSINYIVRDKKLIKVEKFTEEHNGLLRLVAYPKTYEDGRQYDLGSFVEFRFQNGSEESDFHTFESKPSHLLTIYVPKAFNGGSSVKLSDLSSVIQSINESLANRKPSNIFLQFFKP